MGHSNSANSQCVHGMCFNHRPEWENVGEKWNKPNPGIFGKKTYGNVRCCDAQMARYKKVQTKQCKECGRTRDDVIVYDLAFCLCCGHTIDLDPDGD